ncbi:serine/threonine-protein kinase LMTK1 isoform X1 [Sorex araneus]|uniref:serine/threonine-protein kinase LMTK1 isoform X1 n=2 Tax=Sorex araneus TaxID=42254 RepID=UPI0024336178|nr:serine/threonine-protein kinase LMTK1 isoform X1 [Sorex araneus]
MSSSFFNPSFAFSSHFDPDGAPLGELSWSSSLAVVTVSFSGLLMVVALMLACLCCKKGGIGFKELQNAEGEEEYPPDASGLGSPVPAPAPAGPDVYVLPLSQVTLPGAEQQGRAGQLLTASDLGRQDLLQLKDMGHGWFGRVYLGSARGSQVVVKELRGGSSVQEQLRFLEEAQPYRALQHENLLRCLGQCTEATPYLLLLEFCPVGDLKGYLRNCRVTDSLAPDPLTLQRMACEVACGVLHLHRHNYVHSDLALRNCLLTAHLTVKVGDYGLAHGKYREDYLVTADQLWVPLRWIAPELVDEVHSNLLVVSQTKASNMWSLGVTLWELFELGAQPYPHHSDGQVLAYAVREQQLKLPRPQLPLSLSERWYEVMQCCWLQPEQRPSAEEVHLLLTYLCTKGTSDAAEEDFERRWRSLRPGGGGAALAHPSSFPLLERFSGGGDDVLTVTETSRGLDFDYQWEAGSEARAEASGAAPGVVPVLSAHSPSLGSEYFIRLEEPAPACRDPSPPASPGSDPEGGALEPRSDHPPPTAGPGNDRDQSPPLPLQPPSPGPPTPAERGPLDPEPGQAARCPAPSEDSLATPPSAVPLDCCPLGESNASANNNSGHRPPRPRAAAHGDGCRDSCPSAEHGPQAVHELGHPLAPEGPREPLMGLQATPSGQEPGRRLSCPRLCPAVGLAPATCHVASSWTEAARSGGDSPQAEPRLAEEATGAQLPLPSIPSPGDAPLPAEAASAPSGLPASPTPASGCQTAATEPWTLDPGSCPSELDVPGSEDEDTEETPPAAGTDSPRGSPAAEGPGTVPTCHCSPPSQVETPGSLHIPTLASEAGCESFRPVAAAGCAAGQPRLRDSGYDTENYESPELGASRELSSEGGSPGPESQPESQLSTPLGSLGDKSPYRDSAYFSDLESEGEPPTGPAEKPLQGVLAVPELGSGEGSPLSPDASPEPGPALQPPRPSAGPPVPSPARPKVFVLTPVPAGAEAPRERPQEDDDSDDSDSDEEPRGDAREASEDSEEDAAAPVVVVAASPGCRLRSLLRMPARGRQKKAVSFFDDVTVYLFDQESPTREAGEPGAKDSPPASPGRPRPAQRAPEGSAAREGGAFAWGDFPPLSPGPPTPAAPAGTPKPASPGPSSRFTVSPTTPVSRFSITHVSDPDAGSARDPVADVGGCCDEA